jgi:predicted RND superfamily exporter protein
VIVLPLLLGIGVDTAIHLVHRFREDEGGPLLGTSTARAAFYSALTTLASFGTLALSPHRGMASLGLLLLIGLACTLVGSLVVLPTLLDRRASARTPRRG